MEPGFKLRQLCSAAQQAESRQSVTSLPSRVDVTVTQLASFCTYMSLTLFISPGSSKITAISSGSQTSHLFVLRQFTRRLSVGAEEHFLRGSEVAGDGVGVKWSSGF